MEYRRTHFIFKKQSLQTLHIDDSVFTTLRKDKYSGYSFLKCDKEDLIQSGIARGHAIEICSFREKITKGKCFLFSVLSWQLNTYLFLFWSKWENN